MSENTHEYLNALFIEKFDAPGGKEKLAEAGGNFIRDRLREEGFAGKILPRRTVSRSELQVSVNHDRLVKVIETEPRSTAMSMSFYGQPDVRYYTSPRFETAFHTVGSERYEQTEQDIQSYSYPITDFIKKNIVNDIQEIEDRTFLVHSESAVQSLQEKANGLVFGATYANTASFTAYNVNQGTCLELGKVKGVDVLANEAAGGAAAGNDEDLIYPIQKDDFIKLAKLFPGRGGPQNGRLKIDQMLITDTDILDLNAWTVSDVGDKIAGETTLDGWKYARALGVKWVSTIKTDLLRPGNIYAYTSADFLGGFLVLNKLKFYTDKERNRFSFEAWEDISIYFGNVAAVRKLELYAGSVETITVPAQNATTRGRYLPFEEADLGQLNNLVEDNQVFPYIDQY